MELKRAIEILEYNKNMLTCDMSVGRDPEHQDVSPDYYGKDAENLYYAICCVEEYIKNSISIKWLHNIMERQLIFAMESEMEGTTTVKDGVIHCVSGALACQVLANVIKLWEKENEKGN